MYRNFLTRFSSSAHFHHAFGHSWWHLWHSTAATHHHLGHVGQCITTHFAHIRHAALGSSRHRHTHGFHLLHDGTHVTHLSILHLLHHVHDVAHTTHLLEHPWIDSVLHLSHHTLRVALHLAWILNILSHLTHASYHLFEAFVFAKQEQKLSRVCSGALSDTKGTSLVDLVDAVKLFVCH